MAEILQELREKEFDYNLIDKAKLQHLLYWIKDRKIEEMEKNSIISGIFNIKQPVDEMYFKDFMHNLVDLDQTEIKIPNGNVVFKVKKHIKAGANPSMNDLDVMNNIDSLPIEYEIDIEQAHNLTVENRMQLNALLADCWVDANCKVARISGNKVGRLLYLYFIGNSINTLESINPNAEKSMKDKF